MHLKMDVKEMESINAQRIYFQGICAHIRRTCSKCRKVAFVTFLSLVAFQMSEEAFAGVTALTSLDVSNNKLRWLPKSLDLSRVANLTVANNPWSCTCQLAPLRR